MSGPARPASAGSRRRPEGRHHASAESARVSAPTIEDGHHLRLRHGGGFRAGPFLVPRRAGAHPGRRPGDGHPHHRPTPGRRGRLLPTAIPTCRISTQTDERNGPVRRARGQCSGRGLRRRKENGTGLAGRGSGAGLQPAGRAGGCMKRLAKGEGYGNVFLEEVPVPAFAPDQVLVRTHTSLISRGSEILRRYREEGRSTPASWATAWRGRWSRRARRPAPRVRAGRPGLRHRAPRRVRRRSAAPDRDALASSCRRTSLVVRPVPELRAGRPGLGHLQPGPPHGHGGRPRAGAGRQSGDAGPPGAGRGAGDHRGSARAAGALVPGAGGGRGVQAGGVAPWPRCGG